MNKRRSSTHCYRSDLTPIERMPLKGGKIQCSFGIHPNSMREIRALAKSRNQSFYSFVGDLIEIGLLTLEDEGQICRAPAAMRGNP